MQILSQLVNFLKNLAGTRSMILIFFFLLIGGVLVYQYFQKQGTTDSRSNPRRESEIPSVTTRSKDILIAGIALILIISFLIVTMSLIYLLFAA